MDRFNIPMGGSWKDEPAHKHECSLCEATMADCFDPIDKEPMCVDCALERYGWAIAELVPNTIDSDASWEQDIRKNERTELIEAFTLFKRGAVIFDITVPWESVFEVVKREEG